MCLYACLFVGVNICVRHCVCTCIWVPDFWICMYIRVYLYACVVCMCSFLCVCTVCVNPLTHVSLCVCDYIFLHFNLRDFDVTLQLSYATGRHRSAVLLWLPTLRNNDLAGERSYEAEATLTSLFYISAVWHPPQIMRLQETGSSRHCLW